MSDFDSFRKTIKGDIVTQSDPGYEGAIRRWALNAIRRAKIVIYVKTTDDISHALKYAKTSATRIAVRGGGHSPAGASSIEGGMVIDLSKYFTTVKVDPEKKLAYVQGGALWETVDNAAAEHGLAAVGGTVNHTGVGGLSTGGGLGFLTGQHGLVIDNLVQATVVIADGSVLKASPKENPDLFYGIRGGGSNFGIVTEFVYKLHDQRNHVYGGIVIFSPAKLQAIARELAVWWPHATEKEFVGCLFGRGPDHQPAIMLLMFYNGLKGEAEKYTKRFTDIGPIADMRQEMPYKNMNTVMNAMSEHGRCAWMRGVLMDEIPRMLTQETYDTIVGASADGKFDAAMLFEFLPQGKIDSVSPHESPYYRGLPGNAVAIVQWNENTPENAKKGLDIVTQLANLVKVPGEAYGNYSPDPEGLSVAEGTAKTNRAKELFRDNYPKMQDVKRKYDPDMMFNKWFVVNPVGA